MGKKQHLLICLFIIAITASNAQQVKVWQQESKKLRLDQPKFLGKTANQYQLVDKKASSGEVVLLKIDTGFSFIESTINLPNEAFNGYLGEIKDTVFALWHQQKTDSIVIHLLESTKGFGKEQFRRWSINKSKHPSLSYFVHDLEKRYFFFYTGYNDTIGRIVLDGVLLDRYDGEISSVRWPIDFDAEQQRQKMPIVDGIGNIHTVVYDKLTNYKLSANIHIYTRNNIDRTTTVETFGFDKIKFYDLDFIDNPEAQEVQLRGFYYSDNEREKTGLASIGFSYKRGSKLSQLFTPIPEWQKNLLVDGVGSYNKRFPSLDYLKVTGFNDNSGSSFVSAWILDMPYHKFVKDQEQEYIFNTNPNEWIVKPKEDKWVQKSGKPSQRNDQIGGSQSNDVLLGSASYQFGLPRLGPNNSNTLPPTIRDTRNKIQTGTSTTSNLITPGIKKGKIVFFGMNKKGMYDWIQIAPPDFPVQTIQAYGELFGNSMIYDNAIFVVMPIKENGAIKLKLIRISKSGITDNVINHQVAGTAKYGPPKSIGNGHFVSLYFDKVNQQSGLLHFKTD